MIIFICTVSLMHNSNRRSNYQNSYNRYSGSPHYSSKTTSNQLSPEDKDRKKIADDNYKLIKSHKYHIDKNIETVDDNYHSFIESNLQNCTKYRNTQVIVTNYSTIEAAILYHKQYDNLSICILNFADSTKPGGGYLNGRSPQEETICRQTLLYPTLVGNQMYKDNIENNAKIEGSDTMIYSPNVLVIRDNEYKFINQKFCINVISSPAVDNRKNVWNAHKLMESRIRKIIQLAAYKGNRILILGAFGCGIFKNDPHQIAKIFYKVLIKEKMKDYFQFVIFPIYKDTNNYYTFKNIFDKKRKGQNRM